MRKTPATLDEAREERLRAGRRVDLRERAMAFVGVGLAVVLGIVVANAVCGRVVPLGKAGLAAGDPGQAVLVPWDQAAPAFRQKTSGGPDVEARQTAVSTGSGLIFEFRVDGAPAGTVVGAGLRGTRVERTAGRRLTVWLPSGSRPAQETVGVGGWTVRYRVSP